MHVILPDKLSEVQLVYVVIGILEDPDLNV